MSMYFITTFGDGRLTFECPECGDLLEVTDDLMGKRIKCPNTNCNKRILVPILPKNYRRASNSNDSERTK